MESREGKPRRLGQGCLMALFFAAGCGGAQELPQVSISISPQYAQIGPGQSQVFQLQMTGATWQQVSVQLDGDPRGSLDYSAWPAALTYWAPPGPSPDDVIIARVVGTDKIAIAVVSILLSGEMGQPGVVLQLR
jgi:hypothetical protein